MQRSKTVIRFKNDHDADLTVAHAERMRVIRLSARHIGIIGHIGPIPIYTFYYRPIPILLELLVLMVKHGKKYYSKKTQLRCI